MTGSAAVETRPDVRSRIVDVATRLLQESGPAAVTTRAVAQGAGVQAPMIYRVFGDKDGLLDAVAEHVLATYVAVKTSVVETASAQRLDPVADLRAGWRTQIEFGLSNAALFALLSDPTRALRSPAARSAAEVLRSRVHRVAVAGRLRVGEQRAFDLIRAAGAGAVNTLLATPVPERDVGLADAIFEAVLQQILTDAPQSDPSATVGAAVTLRASADSLDMLTESERRLLAEWLDRAVARLSP